ncbi:MAG TPA: serine/threonine-protein kinase [Steroidobacteraceae bacterium]|jgi:serine/threonine-protein kinase
MDSTAEPTFTEIEPYFDAVLDLAEDARAAWLDKLAADKPLIAAAVRQMLAERDEIEAKGFMAGSLTLPREESLVGAQIGAYTVNSLIGRGGMGEVWLALRSDGRFEGRFAIKFLDSYSSSPRALERFKREGRLLARLSHPHISRLIDAGVTPKGRPYLVLEYVEGERIDRYCDTHNLPVRARIALLLDVLAALAHAHSNLVVHRDIKPTNVMVNAAGEAKLLDFGIGKLLGTHELGDTDTAPTRVEEAALTPEYAAPEQILGEDASTATDVYQVGVLMFVLLAGRLPLLSSGGSRAERIKAALDALPPRLSDVAPKPLRKELSGDLDAIAAKALRKLPRERYATAAALADDLKRYLNHEPVAARADGVGYRVRKFVQRYRGAVMASSAAVLALIALTIFALLQMRDAQAQRDRSDLQAKRALAQAEFVGLMMSTVGSTPTTAEQLLDAGVRLLDKHYPNDPEFRIDSLLNLGGRYGDLGLLQKEVMIGQKATELAAQTGNPTLIARCEFALAEVEVDLGHQDLAMAHLKSGKAELAMAVKPDPRFVEDGMEAEALVEDAAGHTRQAIAVGDAAIALLERSGLTHDVRYSSLLGNVADYYKELGDTRTGLDYIERSLAAAVANGQGDTDSALVQIHNIASTLGMVGELKEACSRESELIRRLTASGRSIMPAMTGQNGTCFLRAGNPTEALNWFDRALATASGEDWVQREVYARTLRAGALMALNRLAEAGKDLDRADALLKSHPEGAPYDAARATQARVRLDIALDKPEEARRLLTGFFNASKPDIQTRWLPATLQLSARIEMAQKNYSKAADLAEQSLRAYEKRARNPAISADVGETALLLAKARAAEGDATGAKTAAAQAAEALKANFGEDFAGVKEAQALL